MKTSFFSPRPLFLGLALALGFAFSGSPGTAAESIKGTYLFEGKARAKGEGGRSTKKFKGKMRVGLRTIRLQIPVSRDGRVAKCQKMVRAKLNRRLKRNPVRASRRATFTNAVCGKSKWNGSIRLKWVEHPDGYALSFSLGAVNVDVAADKVTGRFRGKTGTLATEANQPDVPENPGVPTQEEN